MAPLVFYPFPGRWPRLHPHHLSPPPLLQLRKKLRVPSHHRSLNNNQSLLSSRPMISRENTRKSTTPNWWSFKPSAPSLKKRLSNSLPDRNAVSLDNLLTASSASGNESSPAPDLRPPS